MEQEDPQDGSVPGWAWLPLLLLSSGGGGAVTQMDFLNFEPLPEGQSPSPSPRRHSRNWVLPVGPGFRCWASGHFPSVTWLLERTAQAGGNVVISFQAALQAAMGGVWVLVDSKMVNGTVRALGSWAHGAWSILGRPLRPERSSSGPLSLASEALS